MKRRERVICSVASSRFQPDAWLTYLTKEESVRRALHFKRVAEEFPEAEKIRVVLDNLNTHNASAFYETFATDEAFALAQKARVLLHAAKGELAQYDRNRVFRRAHDFV